jgi:hypothetical protein
MVAFNSGALNQLGMGMLSMRIARSKIDEYLANAVRCEQKAKKMRNTEDREWQFILARVYQMLAEAEAERIVLVKQAVRAAA